MKLPFKDIAIVSVQVLLFIACAFHIPAIDFAIPTALRYLGLAVAISGGIIILFSFIALKRNLTPFPSPKGNAALITTGIYKHVRHPIYLGVFILIVGVGVFTQNTLCLIVSVLLLLLFMFKLTYEEQLLMIKFPEYKRYKEHTSALLPGVF